MSQELVINLYEQMINTKGVNEANVIRNIYNSQDYKNTMITKYFNKKCSELTVNEFGKALNDSNIGVVEESRIDIVEIEDVLVPIMTMTDKDNKSFQVALNLNILGKLNNQINGVNAGLSYLKYIQ